MTPTRCARRARAGSARTACWCHRPRPQMSSSWASSQSLSPKHVRVGWYSLRCDRVEGGRNTLIVAVPHARHRCTRAVNDTVEAPERVRSRLKGRAEHSSQRLVQRASTTKANSQRPVRVRDRHETIVVLVILVPLNRIRLASVRTVIDTVQTPMRKRVRLESRAVHPGQRPIDCTTTTSVNSQRPVRVRDRHKATVVVVGLVPRHRSRVASIWTVIDTVQAPVTKCFGFESGDAVVPNQPPIECATATRRDSQRSVRVGRRHKTNVIVVAPEGARRENVAPSRPRLPLLSLLRPSLARCGHASGSHSHRAKGEVGCHRGLRDKRGGGNVVRKENRRHHRGRSGKLE
jgi:hypothetical protein